jgi:uncharacterized protein (DUF433 family)
MAAERHPADLLEEIHRMQRVPGIIFAEDTGGRVPRIAGTGLEVWEIIATYKAVDQSWDQLRTAFDWLAPEQLRAAIVYYETYPAEIDARLDEEKQVMERYGVD